MVFSGDPLKKSDEFIWSAKLNQQAKVTVRFMKRESVKYIICYNSSRQNCMQGVRRLSVKIGDLETKSRFCSSQAYQLTLSPPEIQVVHPQKITFDLTTSDKKRLPVPHIQASIPGYVGSTNKVCSSDESLRNDGQNKAAFQL